MAAIRELPKHFKVLEIDNRFKSPTPLGKFHFFRLCPSLLVTSSTVTPWSPNSPTNPTNASAGWRDFAALIIEEIPVSELGGGAAGPSGATTIKHICEIQLHLIPYAEARAAAHKYYRVLRETLPKLCTATDAGGLQEFVLESLQTVRQGDFFQKANVAVNMDRSKTWTKPWSENPQIAPYIEAGCFPTKRPALPVVNIRTQWMSSNEQIGCGKFPPTVPDLRDNRPWVPAGGLPDGGLFSAFKEEDYADEAPVQNHGGYAQPNAPSRSNQPQTFDERLVQLEYEDAQREQRKKELLNTSGSAAGVIARNSRGRG